MTPMLRCPSRALVRRTTALPPARHFALRGGPYCPVYNLPRVAYHSLSAEIEAAKGFTFLFGVSNLFDKKPPLVSTVGTPIYAIRPGAAAGQLLRLLRPSLLRQRQGEVLTGLTGQISGRGTIGVPPFFFAEASPMTER